MRNRYDIPHTWHIFPLSKNAKVPAKGSAGFHDARRRDEALKKWPDIHSGNVGLYPGTSGLIVIDVDVKHGAIGDATMKKLQKKHGKLPETFTVKTPSGGWHLYFQKPDIKHIGNNSIGEGIDIRCDAGYVLAPGSSIDGKPCTIIRDLPIAALPDAWVELFKPKQKPAPQAVAALSASKGYPPANHADVREALTYISPDLAYDEWVKVLVALKDGGFEDLAHEWSAGSPKYDQKEVEQKLASFTGTGITLATVFHYAKENGYKPDNDSAEKVAKPSQACSLLAIVEQQENTELFHDASGIAYATVKINGVRKTLSVRGRDYRNLLRRELYQQDGRNASAQAIDDALGTIEGQALFDGTEHEVKMRCAADKQGSFWLDLGNEAWQSVKITAEGWEVVTRPDVKWRRPGGMRPLPTPVKGGTWKSLFDIFPLPKNEQVLVIAWLIMTLNPHGPYPLLILQGEQGTGKSTLSKILRGLIDPNIAPIRTAPRNEHDLIVAARNGWIIAIDNLSGIQPWLSDGLCRLATGGGFSARALYSNDDEHIIEATRPCIINGIDDMAARPDLADRAIILNLEPIEKGKVRTEKQLLEAYETARPGIMGALLDAVSTAIRMLPTTHLDELPRMADFALFVAAAESALWEPGTFMKVYNNARSEVVAAGLDGSPVATAIRTLMQSRDSWEGTATVLLDMLPVDDKTAHLKIWPKTARGLSNVIRRLSPSLRADGLDVTFAHSGERKIQIENTRIPSSTASTASKPLQDKGYSVDASWTMDAKLDARDNLSSTLKPLQDKGLDAMDDVDAKIHTQSNRVNPTSEPVRRIRGVI